MLNFSRNKNKIKISKNVSIILLVLGISFVTGFVSNEAVEIINEKITNYLDSLSGNNNNPEEQTGIAQPYSDPLKAYNYPSEWREGQTVQVSTQFHSLVPDMGLSGWIEGGYLYNESESRGTLYTYTRLYVEDNNDFKVGGGTYIPDCQFYDRYAFIFDIGIQTPREGNIYFKGSEGVSQASMLSAGIPYVNLMENDDTVTPLLIDETLKTLDLADHVMPDGRIYSELYIGWESDSNTGRHWAAAFIDVFYIEFDEVIDYPRSEHQLVDESTTMHRLEVWNPASSDIEIPIPDNWEIASISPVMDYTITDNVLTIENALGNTEFTLLFSSVSNDYLSISDTTHLYMNDPSFEGFIDSRWTQQVGYEFDSIYINSTVSSNGLSSLRLEENDNYGTLTFMDPNFKIGSYYLDFDLFFESVTFGCGSDYIYLTTWQGSTYTNTILYSNSDQPDLNRILNHKYYVEIEPNPTSGFCFQIYFYSVQGVVFFDNVGFQEVNHQVETIDYFNTRFSGILNCWTSNGLNPVPYSLITVQIRDRTADTLIKEKELITDEFGFWYWNYEGKIDLKEYEFRSWNWDSHWVSVDYEDSLMDISNWDMQNDDSTVITKVGNTIIVESNDTVDGTTNNLVWGETDLTVSGVNIDYYTIEVGSNESHSVNHWYIKQNGNWDNRAYYIYSGFTWDTTIDRWNLDLHKTSYTAYGDFNFSDVDETLFSMGDIDSRIFYLRDPHYIQAQKSYFTPILVSDSVYYYETNPLNEWDFSEGTQDGWVKKAGETVTVTNNGTIICEEATAYDGLKYVFSTSPDLTYWDSVVLRIKSNITQSYQVWFAGDGADPYKIFNLVADEWLTVDSLISENFGQTGRTHVTIESQNWNIAFKLTVDFFRMVHRDSGLETGYNFEFNENGYADKWDDEESYCSIEMENGYLKLTSTGTTSYFYAGIEEQSIDSSVLTHVWIGLYGSESFKFQFAAGGYVTDLNTVGTSLTDFYLDLSLDGDWSGIETDFDIYCRDITGTWSGTETVYIAFIRLYSESPPNLYETKTDFLLDNEGLIEYITFTDNHYSGDYSTGEYIPKNLTVGSHTLTYSAYYNYFENMVTIPSVFYSYDYIVDENGIMKLLIHDQIGNIIDFDSVKTYIDDVRLYDNYYYFSDTSQTINLTITDLFDNLLYQHTTEEFESFKEIQLTLNSVKIQNLQENPIHIEVTRDAKTYSEWIFSYEIVEYKLETATYDFVVYYCNSIGSQVGSFTTNGTYITFNYAVNSDSAIMVTGETIKDVFDNVISLTNDIDDVNASIHLAFSDQSDNFTLQFFATNQNITFVLENSSFIVDTLNSNFTAILGDLIALDSTISGNFTATFLAIAGNTTLLVNQLNSNFTDISGLIISNNTNLYTQTVAILESLAEIQGLFRVHFDFSDGLGIGIPFSTFKLYTNESRQYNPDLFLLNQSYLSLEAYDYFFVSLFQQNYTINESVDISIPIDIFEIIFRNNNTEFDSIVALTRGNRTLEITIQPEGSVIHRFTFGDYEINVSYIVEHEYEDLTNPANFTVGIHNLYSSTLRLGTKLKVLGENQQTNVLDVGGPLPKKTLFAQTIATLVGGIFLLVIGGILSVTISYLWKTRLIEPVDKRIDSKWSRDNIQKPTVGFTTWIMDKLPFLGRKSNSNSNNDRRSNRSRKRDNNRR